MIRKVHIKKEYAANEFCKSIDCNQLQLRLKDKAHQCNECTAYLFHDYLQKNNYSLIEIEDSFICECPTCKIIKSK